MTFRFYSPTTQCVGKVRHATKADAKRAARSAEHVNGRMQAYRCQHCDGYHVGHRPAPWNHEPPAQ